MFVAGGGVLRLSPGAQPVHIKGLAMLPNQAYVHTHIAHGHITTCHTHMHTCMAQHRADTTPCRTPACICSKRSCVLGLRRQAGADSMWPVLCCACACVRAGRHAAARCGDRPGAPHDSCTRVFLKTPASKVLSASTCALTHACMHAHVHPRRVAAQARKRACLRLECVKAPLA